ncbi:MAG: hypothetical protein ACTH8A_08080, partial [Serratia proteamaculans]
AHGVELGRSHDFLLGDKNQTMRYAEIIDSSIVALLAVRTAHFELYCRAALLPCSHAWLIYIIETYLRDG